MAGVYDKIHGYNIIYRKEAKTLNHYSFDLTPQNSPTEFIRRSVKVINAQDVYDFQSHIVSQKLLNTVLDKVMNNMAAQCKNLVEVIKFIQTNQAMYPWLRNAWQYTTKVKIPYNRLFNFDKTTPEEKVGGFFSIIMWNPINICRAPHDEERGRTLAPDIDKQIIEYLTLNPIGVSQLWLIAVNGLNNGTIDVNQYITICSNILMMPTIQEKGYYTFSWERNQDNNLVPAYMNQPSRKRHKNYFRTL